MQEQENTSNLIEITNRIRILENKYTQMRERLFLINQNMIDQYKKIIEETQDINIEVKDLKNDLFSIKEALNHIITEMNSFARKENLMVLEKYINMLDPLSFVTHNQLEEELKKRHDISKKKRKRTTHK